MKSLHVQVQHFGAGALAIPCQSMQAPNPSIERTNNGVSGLLAFAKAVPPLFASHLKR